MLAGLEVEGTGGGGSDGVVAMVGGFELFATVARGVSFGGEGTTSFGVEELEPFNA